MNRPALTIEQKSILGQMGSSRTYVLFDTIGRNVGLQTTSVKAIAWDMPRIETLRKLGCVEVTTMNRARITVLGLQMK